MQQIAVEKVALVVFDWDGTVMDSVGRIVSSLRAAAGIAKLAVPTVHAAKQIIGLSLDPAFDILFPGITEAQRAEAEQSVDSIEFEYATLAGLNERPDACPP